MTDTKACEWYTRRYDFTWQHSHKSGAHIRINKDKARAPVIDEDGFREVRRGGTSRSIYTSRHARAQTPVCHYAWDGRRNTDDNSLRHTGQRRRIVRSTCRGRNGCRRVKGVYADIRENTRTENAVHVYVQTRAIRAIDEDVALSIPVICNHHQLFMFANTYPRARWPNGNG